MLRLSSFSLLANPAMIFQWSELFLPTSGIAVIGPAHEMRSGLNQIAD